jgi:hypothetical protein
MLCGGYTYPNGRLLPSCFGFVKFLQDFRSPKQELINAFYNMSTNFSFATAKVQKNLRMCKFWVEKVLRVVKVLWE